MLDKHLVQIDELKESDMDSADYDYLLGMKIYALTKERVDELLAEMEELMDKYKTLKKKTPEDLWEEDLVSFETQYAKDMKEYESELAKELAWGTEKEAASKTTKTTKTKVAKKEKETEPEHEKEEEEEPVVVVKKKKTTTETKKKKTDE